MTQEDKEWWWNLTKTEKREVEAKQLELFDENFAQDNDFPMKECFNESIRLFLLKKENYV